MKSEPFGQSQFGALRVNYFYDILSFRCLFKPLIRVCFTCILLYLLPLSALTALS